MEEERIITLRLRKAIEAGPNYKKAKRAISYIKSYLKRHFHTENIKLDRSINERIWKNGAKNPPVKIRIVCKKTNDKVEAKVI